MNLPCAGRKSIPCLLCFRKLTDEEFAFMKSHASTGAALLSDGTSEVVQIAERIAAAHHERWDGRGYPKSAAR